jgi:hypothetical protein
VLISDNFDGETRVNMKQPVEAKIVFTTLTDEIKLAVREEVERALAIGGSGGYFSTKGAARYLDTTSDAIDARVKRGELVPCRKQPRMFTRDELDRWALESL